MSFLSRLLGRRSGTSANGAADDAAEGEPGEGTLDPGEHEHAVTVWLRLTDAAFQAEREQARIFVLEDRVMAAVDATGAGTYETNDLERGFFRMRMHGPDADRLLEVVRPLLAEASPGSFIAARRGPAGTSEERVEL